MLNLCNSLYLEGLPHLSLIGMCQKLTLLDEIFLVLYFGLYSLKSQCEDHSLCH